MWRVVIVNNMAVLRVDGVLEFLMNLMVCRCGSILEVVGGSFPKIFVLRWKVFSNSFLG